MQFSYNWIQDFFETDLPAADVIAREVGLHMFELEGTETLGNGDVLIDWDILPNRSSDCMSYIGIAGEVSAICNIDMKDGVVPNDYKGSLEISTKDKLDFSLQTDLVARATKRYAESVVVAPSPEWLRVKLESIGQKSINNVVDITNYVMWVTGQPVHAFDYDKLSDGKEGKKFMSIRHAADGENVQDLTGAEHELDSSMLVVSDADKALDVAGVKGGINSGVDEGTTRVVISACNYDFKNIRRTSRMLKLRTDASARYENEVPLSRAGQAQALCAQLLKSECSAKVANDFIDTLDHQIEPVTVVVNPKRVNSLLGLDLSVQEMIGLLNRLGMHVENKDDLMQVRVPVDRLDVSIEQDVIEEIGRLSGYVNLEPQPLREESNVPKPHVLYRARDKVAHGLVQMGFFEVMSRTLTDSGLVELHNPLTSEAGYMRLDLLPFLHNKVEKNFAHTDQPQFFEIGKVFTGLSDGLVNEHWSFAGVLGRRKIKEKHKKDLFLQTKGVLETIFEILSVRGVEWKEGAGETVAILEINGDVLGAVGVNWWEINFDELVAAIDTKTSYVKPSKYPRNDRDIAVFVPMETTVESVQKMIAAVDAQYLQGLALFDVYEDVDQGRKSLAFRLRFQSHTETLSDEVVNMEMAKIYSALEAQNGFEIR